MSRKLQESSQISLFFNFRTRIDSPLLRVEADGKQLWNLAIKGSAPLLLGGTKQKIRLEIEDALGLTDGTWHSFAITSGTAGTKIFLDGYQCFSATASLAFHELLGSTADDAQIFTTSSVGVEVTGLEVLPEESAPAEVLARALPPESLIDFAATELSAYDAAELGQLRSGSIFLRYRVRGPGQAGPILAASGGGVQQLQLVFSANGLKYSVLGRNKQWRDFLVAGHWDEGDWHDVVLRVARGAVDIYVDGYLEAHLPGQAFFADVDGLDRVIIGQDFSGEKLFGEVRNASIYAYPLTDGQIQRLSGVKPLSTQCLFDYGYHGAASYRIPSLLMTQDGVLLAGADQRETIPNDAPNSINFTMRRSLDKGRTWEEMRTLLKYPGEGLTGSSVIDSCLLQDKETGRIFVFIDQFPGGIGQPNNGLGKGVTAAGEYLLHDSEGAQFVWKADGKVTTTEGAATGYTLAENGDVFLGSQPKGNVFLSEGEDPAQSLMVARTSFLIYIYSDDNGQTWSKPQHVNHQVKENWMAFLGTGPGTGIQIRHGKYAGRLVVPIYFSTEHLSSFSSAVIYSDDHGRTWQRGAAPNDGRIFDGEEIFARTFTNKLAANYESTVVDRRDGSLMLFMRNQDPSQRVATATSVDGGQSWREVTFHDQLPEIFSQPHAIAMPTQKHPDRLVFANASQLLPYRGRGVLRVSLDGGKNWSISRTFNPYHYVYQCLTRLDENTLGLLWERETQGVYFTTVPLEWFGKPELSPVRA
ncbi:sialidase family protein [Boudabousia marimammalium]|uniref:sialidase family protein n=1 Tax=Boudabousia marimammalium TaxID=156892 RepID=UPI001FEAD268|nr:sialidase family protein [Boudabousia marimammalium]